MQRTPWQKWLDGDKGLGDEDDGPKTSEGISQSQPERLQRSCTSPSAPADTGMRTNDLWDSRWQGQPACAPPHPHAQKAVLNLTENGWKAVELFVETMPLV